MAQRKNAEPDTRERLVALHALGLLDTAPEERFDRVTRIAQRVLEQHGFDRVQHEQIRADLKAGRIGLAQNRLPPSAVIEDVQEGDVINVAPLGSETSALAASGLNALKNGELAVVTLADGAGSRWTQGAGVVKALHPFCKLAGRHRTFVAPFETGAQEGPPPLPTLTELRADRERNRAPARLTIGMNLLPSMLD